MSVEVRKLGEPILAEVVGVDVTKDISDDDWAAVYQAFLDNCVVVFRDQSLTPDQMVRLANRFGPVEAHITSAKYKHPECDDLIIITNRNEKGEIDPFESARGGRWHTDMCYQEIPSKATMLHTLEIPEVGGDTIFANLYLALETMPASLRTRLEGLRATFRLGGNTGRGQVRADKELKNAPLVDHPILRAHPDTGRLSVFVNQVHTVGIVGMDHDDAQALLQEVYDWCERPEFQARHEWRMGDTVIWDNRCSIHRATGENPLQQTRRLMRATISDRPN